MPSWEAFMTPTLRVLSDGVVRSNRELYPLVARDLQLRDEQMKEVLSSGQLTYHNRIGWALSFLAKVGALVRPSRGKYAITDAGRQVLELFPQGVTERQLRALGADPTSPIRVYVARASRGPRPEEVVVEQTR